MIPEGENSGGQEEMLPDAAQAPSKSPKRRIAWHQTNLKYLFVLLTIAGFGLGLFRWIPQYQQSLTRAAIMKCINESNQYDPDAQAFFETMNGQSLEQMGIDQAEFDSAMNACALRVAKDQWEILKSRPTIVNGWRPGVTASGILVHTLQTSNTPLSEIEHGLTREDVKEVMRRHLAYLEQADPKDVVNLPLNIENLSI